MLLSDSPKAPRSLWHSPQTRKFFFLAFLVLTLSVCVVFSGALKNGFVDWDDNEYVIDNPLIHSLDLDHIAEMLVTLKPVYWHPVTWFSHALDYQLYGMNPAGHHFTSIFIHGLNTFWVFVLCVFLLSRKYPEERDRQKIFWVGTWVALAFGLHPLRVESVVWAAERKDLLVAFFMFPAMLTYILSHEAKNSNLQKRWYWLTLFLFFLALMSKPMVVTLPVVFLILDYFPLKRWSRFSQIFSLVLEKLTFFLMSLVTGIVTIYAQKEAGAVVGVSSLSFTDRLINAIHSAIFYLEKTFWPGPLSPLYPFQERVFPLLLASLIFAAITLVCLVSALRGRRGLLAAWGYYLITIAPVIGIVQVGRQAAADRFTYIPTLSLYFVLGAAVLWLIKKTVTSTKGKWVMPILVLVAMTSLGAMSRGTVNQIPVWKNTGTLWQKTVDVYPEKMPSPHFNLGRYLLHHGQKEEALRQFELSLSVNPNYVNTLNDLGLVRMEEKRWREAEKFFTRALKVRQDAVLLNNRGLLEMKQGNLREAIPWLQKALAKNPNFVEAHNNLGLVHGQLGQESSAESHFRSALTVKFDFFPAHANLANLYLRQGRLNQASTEFRLAQYLEPGHAALHVGLGEVLLYARQWEHAQREIQQALRLQPDNGRAKILWQKLEELRASPPRPAN
jgi:tetratricopeptide (TPR) repeat protein